MKFFKKFKNKTKDDSLKITELYSDYSEPLDKLVDGRLPKMWLYIYGETLRSRESSFISLASESKEAKSLDEKISILETLVEEFYEYKDYCYSMGECFIKYFDDMWMHCHNSRNADFCYITPYEEKLNYLKDNYLSIKEDIQNLKNIEKQIIQIVNQHPQGILQVELVKQFPEKYKEELNSNTIYQLIKDKKIRKEKKGKFNLLLPM